MIGEFYKGDSMQLTKDFNLSEFHCHCKYESCKKTFLDTDLLTALQRMRDIAGKITVLSGYRCERHNDEVGGKGESYHLRGMAADIHSNKFSPEQMVDFALLIEEFKNGGIGLYKWGVHVDCRGFKFRWEKQ